MKCQIFEFIHNQKVVGVLESGGIGEIELERPLDSMTAEELRKANPMKPVDAVLNDPVAWSFEKRAFQSERCKLLLKWG